MKERQNMDLELRKSQICQLDILLEIDRICRKYNIQYFLSAGTLLGAVRHKGFIPWDDDLDIGMTRKNYEKFLEISKYELSDKYFLQTWNSDPKFALPFAKLQLLNTNYLEESSRDVDIHHGIFVDIFPYDNLSNKKLLRLIQKKLSQIFNLMLLAKCKYNCINNVTSLKVKIVFFISHFFTLDLIHSLYLYIMNVCNNKETNKIVTFGGASGFEKETLNVEWINNLELREYESYNFFIPKEWNKYLEHFYGDYMTPPPEDQRYDRHKIIERNFGNFDFTKYRELLR